MVFSCLCRFALINLTETISDHVSQLVCISICSIKRIGDNVCCNGELFDTKRDIYAKRNDDATATLRSKYISPFFNKFQSIGCCFYESCQSHGLDSNNSMSSIV